MCIGYKIVSCSAGLGITSVNTKICSKLKLLQPKFTRIIFGLFCILPENLNSMHEELCKIIIFYWVTGLCYQHIWQIVHACDWQRTNSGSVIVEQSAITFNYEQNNFQLTKSFATKVLIKVHLTWKFEVNRASTF